MNRKHYFFFAAIIGMALFAQYDVGRRVDNVRLAKKAQQERAVAAVGGTATNPNVQVATEAPDAFAKRFQVEAQQIGKIQNNPAQVQERLQSLADRMQPKDVEGLFEIISDNKSNPDERALAVELLSVKNDTTSVMALQNFVANSKNVNGEKWDTKKELETVLRAQAIEGIAAYPEKETAISILSHLQQRVEQRFLNERISRASMNLIYDTKPVQQQDEEALKKLVE